MYIYINVNANTLALVIEAKTNSPTLFSNMSREKKNHNKDKQMVVERGSSPFARKSSEIFWGKEKDRQILLKRPR